MKPFPKKDSKKVTVIPSRRMQISIHVINLRLSMRASHSFPYMDSRRDNIPTSAPIRSASAQWYRNTYSCLKQCIEITAPPQSPQFQEKTTWKIVQAIFNGRLSLP